MNSTESLVGGGAIIASPVVFKLMRKGAERKAGDFNSRAHELRNDGNGGFLADKRKAPSISLTRSPTEVAAQQVLNEKYASQLDGKASRAGKRATTYKHAAWLGAVAGVVALFHGLEIDWSSNTRGTGTGTGTGTGPGGTTGTPSRSGRGGARGGSGGPTNPGTGMAPGRFGGVTTPDK